MTRLRVYDDQTGQQLYPETLKQRDEEIVNKFFNSRTDLYISKKLDNLEIVCYVRVGKGPGTRDEGCYIRYSSIYRNDLFYTFKREAERVLYDLKFEPRRGKQDNKIFDSIEEFDPHPHSYDTDVDIDTVIKAVQDFKKLDFDAGDINEIAGFTTNLLKKIANVSITISERARFADINIIRSGEYIGYIRPAKTAKKILDKYEREFLVGEKTTNRDEPKNKIKGLMCTVVQKFKKL
ncbi:MAG: hypothetical protein LAKADJCE_01006 [Candidatus Argoarchaeum ethanivorans]|uniref:Uncharacterized protein n=1 Tax=Candidatus Argoarchaeum ethanivorans TaxID=2608793 RepID=A0A811TC86_9EURY|nr:MAG: hypothetical protein LAKADJCE_01006 [Candidatus Argoarchaeum ethanivorans]